MKVRSVTTAGGVVPLSVVMPVFNEEALIAGALDEVRRHVLDVVPGSELWVIDDGSQDGTAGILDKLQAGEPRLRVVHQPNGGHGAALLAGMSRSRGDWILLVDSDRQIPLDGFGLAWERRRGLDALFGHRGHRGDPLARRLVSAGLRFQTRFLFGARLADPNVPFKLISRRLWEEARTVIPADCLIPSVFVAVFAHRAGFRYASFNIAYRQRGAGETTLRKLRLVKFSARSLAQLVAFRGRRIQHIPSMGLGTLATTSAKKS